MNELLQQLVLIAYGIWRKRWYALATTMVVSLVGLAIVATIPNNFESSARIRLDTTSLIKELLGPVSGRGNQREKLQVMRQTLISRPNLEKVIRRSGLDALVSTDEEIEELIEDLADDIEIVDEGNNIYRFTYSSGFSQFDDLKNAEMATRVVQSILQMIVESDLGNSRIEGIEAMRFVDSQLSDYRRQLDELERQRTEFEQRNIGLIGTGQSFSTRLIKARTDLSTTEAQLNEAQLIRDELQRQLGNVEQFVEIIGQSGPGMGGISDLPGRIELLKQRKDALLARDYTEKHPDVVAVQRQIDSMNQRYLDEQKLLDEQFEAGDGGIAPGVPTSRVPNPVYEATQIRLIEKSGEIASLTGRRTQHLAVLLNLEEQAKKLPLIEAEQNSLNREYNMVQGLYDKMLKTKEDLRLSGDIDLITDGVSYEVVDPPIQPLSPSSPNRPVLLTGVLFLSVGGGIFLALILSQALTTFLTTRNLRDAFDLPVLGSISALVPEAEKRQQRMENRWLAFAYGILFIGFGLFIAFEVTVGPTV